jgi:hypothetical protein
VLAACPEFFSGHVAPSKDSAFDADKLFGEQTDRAGLKRENRGIHL